MAFKMKNPSLMKMAKAAGDNRVAMKMKNEAAMQMKKQAAMKMKKDPMKMKDPMDMKKDPMMMKKDSAMNMGHSPKKMKAKTGTGKESGAKVGKASDKLKALRSAAKVGAINAIGKGVSAKDMVSKAKKNSKKLGTTTRGTGVRFLKGPLTEKKLIESKKSARRSAREPIGPKNAPTKMKKKSPMKATYAEALKKDSNLASYIKKRKTLTKGTPEWNANQNKINAAYGVSKRYPTGGSSGGGKGNTSGIKSDRIINDKNTRSGTKTRGAAIGNKKVIQTTYDDGTRRQETKVKGKSAIEGKKIKQRNYDEKGNLTSKTKEKYRKRGGGGEGMADDYYKGRAKKIKTTTKDANTVTKTKTKFNKDGSVKAQVTRTRKRRAVGLGKLLAGKRAGQRT